ncbi:transcription termination factor 2-like [Rhopilema esculentum]|uniref:transcription termination factor 2-like n=1 Tax=Rhopilema esculentum TaxID=499914 RepID=UPI0031D10AFE
MAGILGKIPCCNEHGKPCFIKTGTKDGPMKGKTFFICSNQSGQCTFVEPASGIPVTNCPHHNKISDLQALCKKQDGMRCYFRCTEGRKMQLGWCGFTKISPVADRKKTHSGVAKLSERNPLENSKVLSVQPTVSISKHTNKPMVAISGKENDEPFTFKDASESNDQNHLGSISSGTREDTMKDLNQAEISRSCVDVKQGKEHNQVTSVLGNIGKVSERQTLVSGQWTGFCNRQPNDINAASSNVPAVSSKTENQRKASSDVIILDDSYEDQDESGDMSGANDTAEQINHQQKLPIQATTNCDKICRVPDCCKFADERSRLLSKQSSLQMQIQMKKKLMQTVNMRALPDGGQRIFDQIRDLERKLKEAKQMCDELPSDHSCDTDKNDAVVDILHAGKDGCPVNAQLDSELFFVSSKGPGSVGDHFQTQRLYDGKMTQSKLKEVGKITKDAIETLHSSLETCPSATTEHDDPNGLLVTLLPHQRQALAWLLWREKQTPSGGILGKSSLTQFL